MKELKRLIYLQKIYDLNKEDFHSLHNTSMFILTRELSQLPYREFYKLFLLIKGSESHRILALNLIYKKLVQMGKINPII